MTFKSTIARIACLLAATLMLAFSASAAGDSAAENSVKAAIVHKIAKFVSWPDSDFEGSDNLLRFCVVGDQMVLDAFETLTDRPIHGRALSVSSAPEPALVVGSCDILYLGRIERGDADEWIRSVAGHPVLTFVEAGQLGGDGSIVTMTVRRNKVSFSINLEATDGTGLRISAQLLQLATSVGSPGG